MYMESCFKNIFSDFVKKFRVTEEIYPFFQTDENFDISTYFVQTFQNMMSDKSTITRYKNVQEIKMGDVKKLQRN